MQPPCPMRVSAPKPECGRAEPGYRGAPDFPDATRGRPEGKGTPAVEPRLTPGPRPGIRRFHGTTLLPSPRRPDAARGLPAPLARRVLARAHRTVRGQQGRAHAPRQP